MERFLNNYSFLPDKDWENVIEILEPKVQSYLGTNPEDLDRQQRRDIVQLALAYAKSAENAEEEKFYKQFMNKLGQLNTNFKPVKVDRFTIDAFHAIDDKLMPMQNDAIFEGQINIIDIPKLIPYYEDKTKISDLNKAIRGQFE